MRRMLTLAAALCAFAAVSGVAAPSAFAGCAPDAKVVHFDLGNHEEVGHAGMHCTTNNGTSYRLVIYVQFNDGDGWYTSGTAAPVAYTFSNGGNPMPTNYVSGDKVIRDTCVAIHTDSFFPPDIRIHTTLENLVTHTVGYDDSPYRDHALVAQDCP